MASANEFFRRGAAKANQASSSAWMRRAQQAKQGGNPPPVAVGAAPGTTRLQWLRQQWNEYRADPNGPIQGAKNTALQTGSTLGLVPGPIQQTGQFSGFGQGNNTGQFPGQFQQTGMPGLANKPIVVPNGNAKKPFEYRGAYRGSNNPSAMADMDLAESRYGTENRWKNSPGLAGLFNLWAPGSIANWPAYGPGQPAKPKWVPSGMSLYDYSYTPPAAPAADYGYGGGYGDYGGGGGGGGGYDYTPPVPTWYLNMLNWNIARRS